MVFRIYESILKLYSTDDFETTSPGGVLRNFIFEHQLIAYFVLTYVITWLFLIPFVYLWRVVYHQTLEPWFLVFLPGAYGPSIAAIIITYMLKGRLGIKQLLAKLLIWRVHWKWYLFVVLAPMALLVMAIAFSEFRETAQAAFDPGPLLTAIPIYLLVALPFGPLAEELGWRGFALPALQSRFTPLVSSLFIGVIWTYWHTPMFWFPGAAIPSFLELSWFSVGLYLLNTIAEAVY